jgi:hypothetical protein
VSIPCSGCGDQAVWAVTLPYQRGRRPGRLLAYCDRDREGKGKAIRVAIPLDYVTDDLFVAFYRDRWTESDPETASLIIFGMPRHELAREARRYLPSSSEGRPCSLELIACAASDAAPLMSRVGEGTQIAAKPRAGASRSRTAARSIGGR